MPELNHSITQWRESLASKTSLSAIEIDELEDHLRNEIKRLVKAGLSGPEAYRVARVLIGAPEDIIEEFDKVNPLERWRDRLLWIIGGYVAYTLINSLVVRPIGLLASYGGQEIGLSTPWTIALTSLVMAAWIGLILSILIAATRHLSAGNKSALPLRIAPWLTVALLVLGISIAPVIGGTINILSVRIFEPETLGTAALSLSIMQSLVAPMLLIIVLVASRFPRSVAQ